MVEDGVLKDAMVKGPGNSGGTYTVESWASGGWTTRCTGNYWEKYQNPRSVPRSKIYATQKTTQTLSADALKAAGKAGKKDLAKTDNIYLLLLYADAERTLPHLKALAEAVKAKMPDGCLAPIVAPLKKSARACVKVREKYRGDFSCLTDLARATFPCRTLKQASLVLDALFQANGFETILIKNRVMLGAHAAIEGSGDSVRTAHASLHSWHAECAGSCLARQSTTHPSLVATATSSSTSSASRPGISSSCR